jgi:uncharacterized cupredoxin-like copper-binding protein
MLLQRIFVLMLALVTLAACGGGQSAGSPEESSDQAAATEGGAANEATPHDMDGMDHGEETDGGNSTEEAGFAFGRPADASDADRTVEISTGNELVFDPAEVTVARGETITFVITNDGDLMHDFVIGDEAAQEDHAEEMAASEEEMAMEGGQHGGANAVSVPAGETVELTWVFDGETDGLLYGCHQAGHYEAGMVGEIIVEG